MDDVKIYTARPRVLITAVTTWCDWFNGVLAQGPPWGCCALRGLFCLMKLRCLSQGFC